MRALTGVAHLVGHCPPKQKIADLILGQGTCLGCGFGPNWGTYREATRLVFLSHIYVSLPHFIPVLPSL